MSIRNLKQVRGETFGFQVSADILKTWTCCQLPWIPKSRPTFVWRRNKLAFTAHSSWDFFLL